MTKEEQSFLLYKEHPKLINYLLSLGCSYHDAEEILQMLQERIAHGKLNPKTIGYFYLMAKNRFHRITKKRQKEKLIGPISYFDSKIIINKYQYIDDKTDKILRIVQNDISDKAQKIIKMLYWENKSRKEIAQELKISENTVKNIIQRGKKKIKYLMEQN